MILFRALSQFRALFDGDGPSALNRGTTVLLFGTLLLFDPIHFPKSKTCLIIGSVCQIGALLGTS